MVMWLLFKLRGFGDKRKEGGWVWMGVEMDVWAERCLVDFDTAGGFVMSNWVIERVGL